MTIERYVKITWNKDIVPYVPEGYMHNIQTSKYNDIIKAWEILAKDEPVYVLVHEDKVFKLEELTN